MMVCSCINMCRVPEVETQGGKFPMPEHHTNCQHYHPILFFRLIYDGQSCIMTPQDAADLENDGDSKYSREDVYISQDQFDNLKEFTGF
jgi:hypothetical protein